MENPTYEFLNYRITKSVILIEGDFSGNLDINFETKIDIIDDNRAMNTIEMTAKDKNEALLINIIMIGNFVIKNEVENELRLQFMKQNASMIMFPFIRSYIASLTSLSGIPPLVLPLYSLVEIN